VAAADLAQTQDELGGLLRRLRRRHARRAGTGQLTVRELARRSGYAYGAISEYLSGKALAPTDRFDVLIRLLGAGPAELRALATARDRVEERRRARRTGSRVPQELPPGVPGFTGRKRELAELDLLLERPGAADGVPPVAVVTGTAGVGKTGLAVHWAHQVRAGFPDGRLYLDLRGYHPDQPVPPAEALAGLLRSLGVAGADVPPGEAERAARLRTLLADRRALVLLDNARDTEQVRPLLPGGSGCMTLVTSRDALTGLATWHGARQIRLDPLSDGEALDLLAALLGGRVTGAPDAAGALARRCARLPLTLRLVAQLASARPEASLAELDAELADLHRRLDALDAGTGPRSATRATFSWSYQCLPGPTARAFRLLGLYPGYDLDGYAVAALAGTDLATGRELLSGLARAHLVQPTGPGRFGMHDLLRAYAAELAAGDPAASRRAALRRLREQQLYACAVAMDLVAPFDRDRRPAVADPGWPVPELAGPDTAVSWLDSERANLIASALPAPAHAGRLAKLLVRYLDTGAHYHDAEQLYRCAARTGTAGSRANALTSLGVVCWRLGRYQEAASHHERALALARRAGDDAELGRALLGLGIVYWHLGRRTDTLDCGQQALDLYRRLDDRLGQARVLGNLGNICTLLGDYPAAVEHHRQALELFREVGDPAGTGNELCSLSAVREALGQYPQAEQHAREALRFARQAGYRECEAQALSNLGSVQLRMGQPAAALAQQRQALDLVRQIGDRAAEGYALGHLGTVHERLGEHAAAVDHHRRGLRIADEIGDRHLRTELCNRLGDTLRCDDRPDEALAAYQEALAGSGPDDHPYQQARAHHGLARVLAATGDHRAAAPHWQQALRRYTRLGVPEAEQVRPGYAEPPADPHPDPGRGS
jgi:tetratricopeptide (TPR) repeat protein/transcriptional regulator with XRE-family HTH domain